MSTSRVNAVEKDLEKFIKFLTFKSAQVIVQSRLGEKIQTQCTPVATGNDWFNIVVEDHPEVAAETKAAINTTQGESFLKRFPLCIEISLRTTDGDKMILEVWYIDLQQPSHDRTDNIAKMGSGPDQMPRASHAIYNRMGTLLKSLISLTRALPAYKLSRRPTDDSYNIYYRIYVEKPRLNQLGEGHKSVKIGQLNTIVGALSMSVAYRTKMTISPTSHMPENSCDSDIILKSDHFRTDATPKQQQNGRYQHCKKVTEKKVIDIEKPLRPGAFTDLSKLKQYTEEDFILPETPPFDWLLKRTRHESGCSSTGSGSIESLNRKSVSPNSPLANGHQHNINNNTAVVQPEGHGSSHANNNGNNNNCVTFKSFENDENQRTTQSSASSQSPPLKSLLIPVVMTPPQAQTEQRSRHGSASTLPGEEENLLKELHFPFATPSSHVNDLAKFYRDCYHAPPLLGLSAAIEDKVVVEVGSATSVPEVVESSCGVAAAVSTNNAAVDDLSKQLEQFETSLEDYDKMISQLTQASTSSGESRSSALQMSN